MTREEAIIELKIAQACGDEEVSHGRADDILCELLESLGFVDVVDEWKKVKKWYA